MHRALSGEVRLTDIARRAGWHDVIAEAGQEPSAVLADVASLMGSFPGRRRVRSLELASRLDTVADHQPLYRTLARRLRKHHRAKLVVEPPWFFHAEVPPVLLAATPRSGNTLVQRLFADALGYRTVSAHVLDDLAADTLDRPPLMQVHTVNDRRARAFVRRLDARVVTIARHPIDVLVSALHFARNEHQVVEWLDGRVLPDRAALADAAPTSEVFVRWALGRGAARFLDVTASWWRTPGVCRLRYEDLVTDPVGVFGRLVDDLGVDRAPDPARVAEIQTSSLVGLSNHHRWRSKPDGWRDLIPGDIAARIERAHHGVFRRLGYSTDGPTVDAGQAAANWADLRR